MGKSTKVDTNGQNAAALRQAWQSKEQLEWAKQIYGEMADERATATAVADQVSRSQLEAQNLQNKVDVLYVVAEKLPERFTCP